jgi:hypothetical protein
MHKGSSQTWRRVVLVVEFTKLTQKATKNIHRLLVLNWGVFKILGGHLGVPIGLLHTPD